MKTNKKMMILSFIGIIMVVLGHTGDQIKLMSDIFPYYSFHMVLFIFISGYFYKTENENNLMGKNGYIFKKVKKLLIPYFIWNLIYGIIVMILKEANIIIYGVQINFNSLFINPWLDGHQYLLNLASWFMPALFLVNIVYILIRKLMTKMKLWNDYAATYMFFVVAICSIFLTKLNIIEYYMPFLRTGFFMFFYQLGYVYKTKIEGKFKINTIVYFLLIIAIQLFILKVDGNICYYAVCMEFYSEFIITPIIVGITGIMFLLKISEILEPALGNIRIVNYISNHTQDIMLHHVFFIFIINFCIYKMPDIFTMDAYSLNKFKNTIWYYHTVGVNQIHIVYTIITISMPLIIRYCYEKIKLKIINKINLHNFAKKELV